MKSEDQLRKSVTDLFSKVPPLSSTHSPQNCPLMVVGNPSQCQSPQRLGKSSLLICSIHDCTGSLVGARQLSKGLSRWPYDSGGTCKSQQDIVCLQRKRKNR